MTPASPQIHFWRFQVRLKINECPLEPFRLPLNTVVVPSQRALCKRLPNACTRGLVSLSAEPKGTKVFPQFKICKLSLELQIVQFCQIFTSCKLITQWSLILPKDFILKGVCIFSSSIFVQTFGPSNRHLNHFQTGSQEFDLPVYTLAKIKEYRNP